MALYLKQEDTNKLEGLGFQEGCIIRFSPLFTTSEYFDKTYRKYFVRTPKTGEKFKFKKLTSSRSGVLVSFTTMEGDAITSGIPYEFISEVEVDGKIIFSRGEAFDKQKGFVVKVVDADKVWWVGGDSEETATVFTTESQRSQWHARVTSWPNVSSFSFDEVMY